MKSAIPFFDRGQYVWEPTGKLRAKAFNCGFCSQSIASELGYCVKQLGNIPPNKAVIHICPHCQGPTFFTNEGDQIPAPAIGQPVPNVKEDLRALYEEARRCTTTGCYTAAVLLCRKMLMNIAVSEGAKEGRPFIEYVEYLSDQHYVPPKGKHWVDHIRKKGNEATHEIKLMGEAEAKDLLSFVEMLLRFIYEFPARVPPQPLVAPKSP